MQELAQWKHHECHKQRNRKVSHDAAVEVQQFVKVGVYSNGDQKKEARSQLKVSMPPNNLNII